MKSLFLATVLFAQSALAFIRVPAVPQRSRALDAVKKQFDSFDAMLESFDESVALIDFYAVWCGPCQLMAPVLEKLADSQKGKVAVGKVDTDRYPQLGSRFQVEGLPTFIIFKDGDEVKRIEGAMSEADLMEIIEPFL
mmetsp:Transcript_55662/g.126516  ORF Transcript_55662/g.126516 Transcript_55662/m.126516 type:complete len:138 (+) Transcript_55662:106-519(+)|eukprot:CAMPEP_0172613574 /NCGR_PEP_ID=MMETSP1068-20121228/44774_1 /TAXON_ID=35684 /ORGANISM="Pseudopedinella elastica, Strain CCMP716" /LENGTH=137 /DNA_ID=CAMNT_0013418063 /DNA_START=73 /DNA_END=486 /DNA_ORIENTATION=+